MIDIPLRIPLEPMGSTLIGAAGYDARRRILAVQFSQSGTIYHYADVPLNVALALGAAESKGRVYSQQIKGRYQGQRMTGPCASCSMEGWAGETCADCGTAEHVVPERRPRQEAS